MGLYDRDHRQNDPWKKYNDSFKFNESKGEIEIDPNNLTQPSFHNRATHISKEAKAFNLATKNRRIQKQFDDQISDLEKNKNLAWVIPWIVALLIILVISKEFHKRNMENTDDTVTSQNIEKTIFKTAETLSTPPTSILSTTYDQASATCPLTLIADSKNYYIKLSDMLRGGKTVATFFIREGEEITTTVPAGNYKIKFGSGNEWYGEKELFGEVGQYGESESLTFDYDGFTSQGHTISFYKQVDGNLHTNNIRRDSIIQN